MIFRILSAALVAAALLLTGCLPESKNPLSLPSVSFIDARLEGVYAQRNKDARDDAGYWHFHYRGARGKANSSAHPTPWLEILSVEPAKDGGLKTNRYEALATRIAGRDYFSFVGLPDDGAKMKSLPYSFARYEVNWRGDLRVWIASDKAFAAAIKAGQLRGTVIHSKFGDTVKITDTTARLAAFIAASDPKVLFSDEPLVMRRIAR
jgi:hypothetical protein